ncbi:MAG: aminotransferase class III-fold pyridoxal phosphate-dependent enzyme [Solirubrobacterales bacterium]|nr:aminotransferase class III-fold pyridoxal phosphate-dependent enzyme [Solirubrobacterales bacterium]
MSAGSEEAGLCRKRDLELRARAEQVIAGGMYGHLHTRFLSPGFPQFMAGGRGARIWDTDGNEFVDLMCSWGPVLLGHRHPLVEEAVERQMAAGDCLNGPTPVMVDLAERLVEMVRHADWAMFMKNGTDATTASLTIARAATSRRKILVARRAYHGSAPWCTPGPLGTTAEDRAHLITYDYNDLASLEAATAEAGEDLAAILVSPVRLDAGYDSELPTRDFARGLRGLCDRAGAALIMDEVRCGLRLNLGGSWEHLGVEPDLSCWSKALANGYSIAAVLGSESLRDAAGKIFVTGSFWFSAVAMSAALATLDALEQEGGLEKLARTGAVLRAGWEEQSAAAGIDVHITGPVEMPYMTFVGDHDHQLADVFSDECLRQGAYLHPRHNWFLSTALDDAEVDSVLRATDRGFSAVKEQLA